MEEEGSTIGIMALRKPEPVSPTATWSKIGITVAGGDECGDEVNKLHWPCGLVVEENGTLLIADNGKQRIVELNRGDNNCRIVAGGNGFGEQDNQLGGPTDVVVDQLNNSLIISDRVLNRVVRWSRQNGTTRGEIIIDNINCWGIAMDNEGSLYVTNTDKGEVRRYARGDKNGTIVAGGNGRGYGLNRLGCPAYVFVDREHSLYVSDQLDHRVMKWVKGAKDGIVIAGDRGEGEDLTQLSHPRGLFVDELGTLYVAEWANHRVTRWCKGEIKGNIIAGGNGRGYRADQLNGPTALSFDVDGNLYVADWDNCRVQRFNLEKN